MTAPVSLPLFYLIPVHILRCDISANYSSRTGKLTRISETPLENYLENLCTAEQTLTQ